MVSSCRLAQTGGPHLLCPTIHHYHSHQWVCPPTSHLNSCCWVLPSPPRPNHSLSGTWAFQVWLLCALVSCAIVTTLSSTSLNFLYLPFCSISNLPQFPAQLRLWANVIRSPNFPRMLLCCSFLHNATFKSNALCSLLSYCCVTPAVAPIAHHSFIHTHTNMLSSYTHPSQFTFFGTLYGKIR